MCVECSRLSAASSRRSSSTTPHESHQAYDLEARAGATSALERYVMSADYGDDVEHEREMSRGGEGRGGADPRRMPSRGFSEARSSRLGTGLGDRGKGLTVMTDLQEMTKSELLQLQHSIARTLSSRAT